MNIIESKFYNYSRRNSFLMYKIVVTHNIYFRHKKIYALYV